MIFYSQYDKLHYAYVYCGDSKMLNTVPDSEIAQTNNIVPYIDKLIDYAVSDLNYNVIEVRPPNSFGEISANTNYTKQRAAVVDTLVPGVIKRAEKFMRTNASEQITAEILAGVAGCSSRTLQNAFRTFSSTTPMEALRNIRLEYARNDLKGKKNSVTQVALKYGFSNPGRFAALYNEKFNEKPSRTLLVS